MNDITKLVAKPRNNGTVVILGAGASFGSSVKDAPPVMEDFIKEGRKRKLDGNYSKLWNFLDKIGFRVSDLELGIPNIEELYTKLYLKKA